MMAASLHPPVWSDVFATPVFTIGKILGSSPGWSPDLNNVAIHGWLWRY